MMQSIGDLNEVWNSGKLLAENERNGGALILKPNGVLVKLFPKKGGILSCLRRVFAKTKAHKQIRSARFLIQIGLKTPEPIEVILFSKGPYEAAYCYQYKADAKDLRVALLGEDSSEVLSHLAEDIAQMARNDALFIDLHFGNALVDEEGELWWIDPEIKISRTYLKRRFWSRIERIKTKTDPGVLSDEKWSFFQKQLKQKLPDFLARESVSEVS